MKLAKRNIFVITGPESTGKTTLSADLAAFFGGSWVPEYAREYISGLDRAYTYEDVEHIANYQVKIFEKNETVPGKILFLDTDLIILKIWFQEVFHRYPEWLEKEIGRRPVSGYLLCATDLPWIPDPVRENPGNKREILFRKYQDELLRYGFIYRIVTGSGEERTRRAAYFVREMVEEIKEKNN